jgi:hypothetical protein
MGVTEMLASRTADDALWLIELGVNARIRYAKVALHALIEVREGRALWRLGLSDVDPDEFEF